MQTEQLFALLEAIHPLSPECKKALRKELEPVSYPKGHFLSTPNSIAGSAHFLTSGYAVSYYYHELKRTVTGFWQPGSIILSPRSFFEQVKSEEAIQLTADSELLALSYASVIKLFNEFPMAHYLARAVITQYYQRSESRLLDFHHMTAWQRYRRLIESHPTLEQNASQELIASYLTITPQSLSRLKHDNR